jgi:hypothetical protein
MATIPPFPTERRWGCRVLLGLLMTLTVWTAAWSQARTRSVENVSLKPQGAQMHVTVNEGSLSVDLREAPVREVLAMIGQQAGLHVRIDAATTPSVSAQFTAMALDQGLRRLLRGTSLSYALLYTRGPAATAILHEVRVFGEARGEGPANNDRAPVELAQRMASRLTPSPQEAPAEPQPADLEPEVDTAVEPESTEPAEDADVPED